MYEKPIKSLSCSKSDYLETEKDSVQRHKIRVPQTRRLRRQILLRRLTLWLFISTFRGFALFVGRYKANCYDIVHTDMFARDFCTVYKENFKHLA